MRRALLALATLAVGCGNGSSEADPFADDCGDGSPEVCPQWCERTAEETACLEKGWIMLPVDGALTCLPPVDGSDPEECAKRSGYQVWVDVDVYWGCLENTTDAGCPCLNGSECFGYCEAPAEAEFEDRVIGTCSKRTAEECFRTVEDGIASWWVCL